jgi:mono/diheme cytochrome c family protein
MRLLGRIPGWLPAILALAAVTPEPALSFPWSIDMFRGPAVQPMATSPRVMPPGAISVDGEPPLSTAASRKLQNPLNPLRKDVAEGQKLYSAYCSACHGSQGHGDGPVRSVLRTAPADLTSRRVIVMKDGSIYGTIRNGTEIMPSYGDALSRMERWRIVLFVRELQNESAQSNSAPLKQVSPPQR